MLGNGMVEYASAQQSHSFAHSFTHKRLFKHTQEAGLITASGECHSNKRIFSPMRLVGSCSHTDTRGLTVAPCGCPGDNMSKPDASPPSP
uniref:Uncharacterized protein n=1 Tax=Anguilla anguilla TaxID=7936 RepID=A0A0E9RDP3_ANGAN